MVSVGATDDVAVVDNVVDLVHRVIVVIDLARFQSKAVRNMLLLLMKKIQNELCKRGRDIRTRIVKMQESCVNEGQVK